MKMGTIYEDDAKVGELTAEAFERTGSRLLQIHRFSTSEVKHVEDLLKIFEPQPRSVIADVGCGVGRLAEMMSEQRSDYEFILINKSTAQLAMCPARFAAVLGTAEELPLERGDVDAIMATYVLGHVDLRKFLSECDRVLDRGDHVYVYDLFVRDDCKPCRIKQDLGYAERTVEEMAHEFVSAGFNKVGFTCYAYFVPAEIRALMPRSDTLRNTLSAAMVFRK